jgi:CO/xanthine dehydrogenase FAD-binding subunit
VDFLAPADLAAALELRAERPDALPLAGGTDVMVELNLGDRRPGALLDLTRVAELRVCQRGPTADQTPHQVLEGVTRLGAGVTYAQLVTDLGAEHPALAAAARTVGSPQIRNRGTVGGNLGTASPAGDAHPPLLALGAEVEVASVRGTRVVPVAEFFTGPGRSVLAADELVVAVRIPAAGPGQAFAKVGARNAMVIAVCSLAVVVDPAARRVGTGIGSAGPVPLRAHDAEDFLAGELDRCGWVPSALPGAAVARFGELVAAAARPIDDLRGSAAYRRHALAVLARRAVGWVGGGLACA